MSELDPQISMSELDPGISMRIIHDPAREGDEIIENSEEEVISDKYDLLKGDEDDDDAPVAIDGYDLSSTNDKLRLDNLSDYEISDSIGKGSFGSVVKAKLKPFNDLKTLEATDLFKMFETEINKRNDRNDRYEEYKKIHSDRQHEEYKDEDKNDYCVAIKIMKEKKEKKEEGVTQDELIKEFNLRLILNEDCKSHLVCYYDAFVKEKEKEEEEENKLILIMSLVTGKHLFYINKDKYSRKQETYTDDEKEIITKQLLSAVKTLHSHNIVHRDIKPANIIYDKEKKYTTLIDYGFSCAMPKIEVQDYVERCSDIITKKGTPIYIDPRIFQESDKSKKSNLDILKKSDLYSLGLVLFDLWIGLIRNFISEDILTSPLKTEDILYELDKSRQNDKIKNLIRMLINGDENIDGILKSYNGYVFES